MRFSRRLAAALTGAAIAGLSFSSFAAAAEPEPFYQGFETDTAGWTGAIRVASATGGITSQAGAWHAQATGGTFTFWGGSSDTFPEGGYTTSLWIYLDVEQVAADDTRFDFTSAIYTPEDTHRRDFVFNGGFYHDTDTTGTDGFVFTASNNAGRGGADPRNPARDPFAITESGWYEFRHVFSDDGTGVLGVDLEIWDADGALLHSWTLSDPSDVIGDTVGGNGYGWFATQEFLLLAFDETRLSVAPSTPESTDDCKNGGWMDVVDEDGDAFDNQGDCVSSVKSGKQ